MTKEIMAKLAADECSSEKTSAHCGGEGKPFWNQFANQYMYAPSFQFHPIDGIQKYRFKAENENGGIHVFETDKPYASIAPMWAEIPEGVVKLTVYSLDKDGNEVFLVGARTFFKSASFPADLPGAARPYSEAAAKAFRYAMSQKFLRHWLTEGTPDPDYDLNVYPSKMISSIINAMLYYAEVCPEEAEEALCIARNCADYMMKITPRDGVMKNVPPTYQIDFRPDYEHHSNNAAGGRIDWVMMIYPAHIGMAYLNLEKKIHDGKYLDEAIKIGKHYLENVQENGSWFLIRNIKTGEVLSQNYCDTLERIVPFLMGLYERTGDNEWKKLADKSILFVENGKLKSYEWEGQFEDSYCSVNYSNLTHYGADALIRYYARFYSDDEEKMKTAEELMRFVEDQFVVWKRTAPWSKQHLDTSLFHTPCGYEQYLWYVPIDASTADIMLTFLELYKAGRGEIYLEKAKALADSITRVQQENGMIPTHWMAQNYIKGDNFWINCMFASASALAEIAEITEKR